MPSDLRVTLSADMSMALYFIYKSALQFSNQITLICRLIRSYIVRILRTTNASYARIRVSGQMLLPLTIYIFLVCVKQCWLEMPMNFNVKYCISIIALNKLVHNCFFSFHDSLTNIGSCHHLCLQVCDIISCVVQTMLARVMFP